jgi:two-component system chemotaxis response regulator CheB
MTLLRVMVVDDSLARREQLAAVVEGTRLAKVVGTASDGAEAMQLLQKLKPDVITLDLEMPRIDGFSFLRLMMSTRPTPVIVISSDNKRDSVFKALELGALDFISVPEGGLNEAAQATLAQKLISMRAVRSEHLSRRPPPTRVTKPAASDEQPPQRLRPRALVAFAASTGGPSALTKVLSQFEGNIDAAFVVAQHMRASFTGAFADRMNRYSSLDIREACEGDRLVTGSVLVCPGNRCMEVVDDGELMVRLVSVPGGERYVPSGNLLFRSVASAYGPNAVGVVLTGMGDDGAEGARRIAEEGGRVIVESESSSVVYGMPRAALASVPISLSVPLDDLASAVTRAVARTTRR